MSIVNRFSVAGPAGALLFFMGGLLAVPAFSQEQDTTLLNEVMVKAYFVEQPLLRLTTSAGVVANSTLENQSGVTLIPALNTVPGVRMEERSPGSYRLSIRGSLLRSPFGVRNVKVYLDEIPLTDAGGNTYLNLLDVGSMDKIEILKGPDGSLFGANSGGVVLIRPDGMTEQSNEASLRVNGGSYGLFHQQLNADMQPSSKYQFSFNQAYQRSDGYRQNSAMKRASFQTVQRWKYRPGNELRLLALYSDLQYRTPGGLNLAQFQEDPRLARPPGGPNPGALEQQAGIINKTLIGGLVHNAQLTPKLRHVASVFGLRTDFSNPFITNYEVRDEYNFGFRTYLDYADGKSGVFTWRANAGVEWQRGRADIYNYDNNGGERGDEQAADALKNAQHFYFARFSADLYDKLSLETSLSLNYYRYAFRAIFPGGGDPNYTDRNFDAEWMPRAALSYLITPQFAWRASVSRGYSPPTTAEVRSSDQVVNTALEAETGWNYETGFRWQNRNRRVFLDGSVFYYRMEDAIIRQLDEGGAEFFSNAGGVKQLGTELSVSVWAVEPRQSSWLRGLQIGTNLTLSHFRFGDYQVADNDFSGNKLTGVPAESVVSNVLFLFPFDLRAYVMHNYTSAIPLDDANSFFADAYHLLQAKVSWTKPMGNRLNLQFFVGADNLLNQRYSLGNDINAFGGRFFNTAAGRNFYGGVSIAY
ncbi:TonB-dependent receptor [Parapedobacter lycopersici]|uniref:TonB-dependent receptor n=1 Tax=Parapedobacter lycopersici TaxID=1864939 RepID=UPI00214D6956|nr:TonB-dependent receptor [Parapedobacter lycopersici]